MCSRLLYSLTSLLFLIMLSGCSRHDNTYQGYIEGRYIYLASTESGTLQALSVSRGQQVAKGDTAFTLDLQPQAALLAQAEERMHQASADIQQAEENLALNERTLNRQLTLLQKNATQQEQVDIAQRNVNVAKAQLVGAKANFNAAQANFKQAQWSHAQKSINIPSDARVFDTYYLPGEFVPAGRPVVSLLPPHEIKAIFFIPESLLSQVKLGQVVLLHCDHCQTVSAPISYISPTAEYTPPVIYSESRRHFLSYRIEADLADTTAILFHPGQPIDIEIANAKRH